MTDIEKKARRRIKRFVSGEKAHRVRKVCGKIYRYVVEHSDASKDLVFRITADGRLYKMKNTA